MDKIRQDWPEHDIASHEHYVAERLAAFAKRPGEPGSTRELTETLLILREAPDELSRFDPITRHNRMVDVWEWYHWCRSQGRPALKKYERREEANG